MRSIVLTLNFPPVIGGIETILHQICLHSDASTVVGAPKVPGSEPFDSRQPYGVRRLALPGMESRAFRARCRLLGLEAAYASVMLPFAAALAREVRPDVVQIGHGWLGLVGWWLQRSMGLPYAVYGYGSEIGRPGQIRHPLGRCLRPLAWRGADHVFAISDYTAKQVQSWGVPASRISLVPMADRSAGRDDHRLGECPSDRRPMLLSVGRLVERKGFDTVLQALPTITRSAPDIQYVLVGDGPDRERLQAIVQSLNLTQHVTFAGMHADPTPFFRQCTAFIMPSREIDGDYEGYGLVYLEANAFGKPVIGGRSGGVPDAVLDGVTGLLADPHDPEDVARQVLRLVCDPEFSARLGEAGRRRVREELSWAKTAKVVSQRLASLASSTA